jgi:hypothetical protein
MRMSALVCAVEATGSRKRHLKTDVFAATTASPRRGEKMTGGVVPASTKNELACVHSDHTPLLSAVRTCQM